MILLGENDIKGKYITLPIPYHNSARPRHVTKRSLREINVAVLLRHAMFVRFSLVKNQQLAIAVLTTHPM